MSPASSIRHASGTARRAGASPVTLAAQAGVTLRPMIRSPALVWRRYIRADSFGSRFQIGSRSEEHTSELQSLMRISYAVFCLKKKKTNDHTKHSNKNNQRHT